MENTMLLFCFVAGAKHLAFPENFLVLSPQLDYLTRERRVSTVPARLTNPKVEHRYDLSVMASFGIY
jgi:hypothetical protein